MKTKQLTRRQAIKGLGGMSLALPFLPSLLARELWGQTFTVPKRFVSIINWDGNYEPVFYPSVDANVALAQDIYYRQLSGISGPISELLGNAFDSVRSKMNIYRGLDVVGSVAHSPNNMLASCSVAPGGDPLNPIGTSRSMDVLLSQSKNFYPQLPAFSALRGAEGGYETSVSIDRDPLGKPVYCRYLTNPEAMFQQIFGSAISNPSVQQAFLEKRITIGDLVLGDYQRLRNGRRIGAEDKIVLDNFVSRLQDLNTRINRQQQLLPNCNRPTLKSYTSYYYDQQTAEDKENFFFNYVDTMVAAMACDLTRICNLSIKIYGHDHGLSHGSSLDRANQLQYLANTQKLARIVAYLVNKMDAITESNNKTMLDNSIVFWGSEAGASSSHSAESMSSISFGSAGGNIRTGYYMDYRQRPLTLNVNGCYYGRSYTQLLITFMRALGLQPSEYLPHGDGGGFGSFNRDAPYTNGKYYPYEQFRNDTLPFISLV